MLYTDFRRLGKETGKETGKEAGKEAGKEKAGEKGDDFVPKPPLGLTGQPRAVSYGRNLKGYFGTFRGRR